jgi:hypothetical protein
VSYTADGPTLWPVRLSAGRLVVLVVNVVVVALSTVGVLVAPADAATITPPVIVTEQPADLTVTAGEDAAFEAHAVDSTLDDAGDPAGVEVPVSSWQQLDGETWADLPDTAGVNPLMLSAVPASTDGARYRAAFDDGLGGLLFSAPATLHVNPPTPVTEPPQVTLQPLSVTVAPGSPFELVVDGTGEPTPTVRWQVAGSSEGPWTDVGGATSKTLSLSAGPVGQTTVWYRAVLTNSAGEDFSAAAAVTTSIALPQPVASVSVSNPTPGTLSASWPGPSGAGGPVTNYLVLVRQGDTVVTSTSTDSAFTSFALPAGTYTVSVTPSNEAGSAAATTSSPVTVRNLVVTRSVSATSVYPFTDGYRDSVTFEATSNFTVSGKIRLVNASGVVARSWTLASGKSWSIPFTGRTSSGSKLPYGAYTVRFTIGGQTPAATTLTLRRTEARVTSAAWAYATVYPVKDGYRDTVKLSVKTDKPATMAVTYTKYGSSKVLGTATLTRRTSGTFIWTARFGGRVVSAGKYRAKIVVKGGDGSARTYYRYVNVSLKKITASKFTGTITATGAYISTIAGSPVKKSSGRVVVRWTSSKGSDIALMGAQLPASFQDRYSGIVLHACVDQKFTDNQATVVLADAQVTASSRKVGVPDSGCASVALPTSYVVDRQVYWYTGNFSGETSVGVLDHVNLSLTRYFLK